MCASYRGFTGGGATEELKQEKDDVINIFSVASGHLYERFLRWVQDVKVLVCSEILNNPSFCVCWGVTGVTDSCLNLFISSQDYDAVGSEEHQNSSQILVPQELPVPYFQGRIFDEMSVLRTHSSASLWFPKVKNIQTHKSNRQEHTFNSSFPLRKSQNSQSNTKRQFVTFVLLIFGSLIGFSDEQDIENRINVTRFILSCAMNLNMMLFCPLVATTSNTFCFFLKRPILQFASKASSCFLHVLFC